MEDVVKKLIKIKTIKSFKMNKKISTSFLPYLLLLIIPENIIIF